MSRTRKTSITQRNNEIKRKEIVQYIVNGMDAEAQDMIEKFEFSGFMMGVQMATDFALIELHREFGFGAERGMKWLNGAQKIMDESIAEMRHENKECGEIPVAEHHIDEELREMMGQDWPEFTERYFADKPLYCDAFEAIRAKIDLRNKQAVSFNAQQKQAMMEAAAKVVPGSPVYTRRMMK